MAAPRSAIARIGKMCPTATWAGAATGHQSSTMTPADAPHAEPSAAPVAAG